MSSDNAKRKEVPPEEEEAEEAKRQKLEDSVPPPPVEDAAAAAAASEVLETAGMKDDTTTGETTTPAEEAAAAAAVDSSPPLPEAEEDKKPGKKKPSRYTTIPGGKDSYAENFNHYLFQLILFKAENNNFHVPRDVHPDLHGWLQFLKREFKHRSAREASENPTSLTPEQITVLQFLHVPLTSRGDDHWNRFFHLLTEYKTQHGHVLVPRLCEIPGLGDWVTDQRRQYKAWKQGQPSQLSKDRRDKLEQLGFTWQVRNRPEWDDRYKELLIYKEKHGDCKVPQHYKDNKALGKWVAKQREQYKLLKKGQHSFLTPYRLERLEEVGFVWQVRTALDTDLFSPVATAPVAASSAAAATTTSPAMLPSKDEPTKKAEEPTAV